MGLLQSMSLVGVKSWRGTYFHVGFALFCVTFNIPNIVLANLVFTYFSVASASSLESVSPIEINVSVNPHNGLPHNGVLNTSPNVPLPFALGIITLYLNRLGTSFT